MKFNSSDDKQEEELSNARNIIGKGTKVKGDLETFGNLRIEGKMIGNLKTISKLIISNSSEVGGNVTAQNAHVEGTINGNIEVSESLYLKTTAVINGDISTSKLIVEDGAVFNGGCKMSVSMKKVRYFQYCLISLVVIGIDQIVKMLVHFNMEMGVAGQIHIIDDIFKLHYLTNAGMAFGMELGSDYGKLFLTLFRLVAMGGISYYLYLLIHKKAHRSLLYCVALILGGAIGNVIDSIFYGVLLDNAPFNAVSPWFHGQVIDMFYIDIWEGRLPDWIPFLGGQYMALWPVFNVADSSIFIGVSIILIFQKRFFSKNTTDKPEEISEIIGNPEPVSSGSEMPEKPS